MQMFSLPDIRFSTSPEDPKSARLVAVSDAPVPDARDRESAVIAAGRAVAVTTGDIKIADIVDMTSPTPARTLLVYLGADQNGGLFEAAGGAAAAMLDRRGEAAVVLDVTGLDADVREAAGAHIAFGLAARACRCDKYRGAGTKNAPMLERIDVIGAGDGGQVWIQLLAQLEGMALARALVFAPPNILDPAAFAARAGELAKLGVEVRVLDESEMRGLGMGALLAVASGSSKPPRLVSLMWHGSNEPPLAFVGKGVTFDSGGISIKPAPAMETMKKDMAGAAAVLGAMHALARRRAPVNVVGICALVENMPDGAAMRPGDVVMSHSGRTIEILNTDAEGRLVLADALSWVQREFRPRAIIDVATLTGAVTIALGHEHAGLFANSDSLAADLLAAGKRAREPLWRLPLGTAYAKLIESAIADMKNIGPAPASAITAAQFLAAFVDDRVDWAHLDIAGMVWSDEDRLLSRKGPTGFGVRLLDELAERMMVQSSPR